jgi:hypothetical protein
MASEKKNRRILKIVQDSGYEKYRLDGRRRALKH